MSNHHLSTTKVPTATAGLQTLISIICPLLIYITILMVRIPKEIGLTALHSFIPVLVTILLFYPAYRLSGWLGRTASLSLTLILFALPLSGLWNSGLTIVAIGGLLPFDASDASGYYLDALRLLEGGTMSAFSQRPLFPGMFATVLGLTQQNLQITQAIFVAIVAISCFLFAREIQRSHGPMAGLLIIAILFLFYRRFFASLTTESLGLTLGAVGFAIVWRGTRQRHINSVLLGIFLLTLGLNARAGAFFVLPALILWGSWTFRGRAQLSLYFLIGGVCVVLSGFLLNLILLKVVGPPDNLAFSNFSYTLYGIIVGGKGWTQVLADYPELWDVAEPERSRIIYKLAFEAFQANPFGLVIGALTAWWNYLKPWSLWGAFSFIHDNTPPFGRYLDFIPQSIFPLGPLAAFITRVLLYPFCLWQILHSYRQRQQPENSLLVAVTLGILISVPFLPPKDIGMNRVYAATIPILATLATLGITRGISFVTMKMKWPLLPQIPTSAEPSRVPIFFGCALIAFIFLGSITTKIVSQTPQFAAAPCQAGMDTAYVRISAGSSVTLVEDRSIQRTRVPIILFNDFKSGLSRHPQHQHLEQIKELSRLSPSTTIMLTFDLKNSGQFLLIVKNSMMPKEPSIVRVCGKQTTSGFFYADSIQKIVVNSKD